MSNRDIDDLETEIMLSFTKFPCFPMISVEIAVHFEMRLYNCPYQSH